MPSGRYPIYGREKKLDYPDEMNMTATHFSLSLFSIFQLHFTYIAASMNDSMNQEEVIIHRDASIHFSGTDVLNDFAAQETADKPSADPT